MSETIYDQWCPKCDAVVWYSNGDESKMTGHDTTHLVCHACKTTFILPDYVDLFDDPDGESPYAVRMVGQSYPDQQSALSGERFAE